MKRCRGPCKQELALTAFGTDKCRSDGLTTQCKTCRVKKTKEYRNNMTPEQRERNRERNRAYQRKWQKNKNNHEKAIAQVRKWRENNPEKVRASLKKYRQNPSNKKKRNAQRRKRYKEDPEFKILHNIRTGMRQMLKGTSKCASTLELLGCTLEQFKSHMEEQFKHGMNWNDQGEWQMDHIVPCASFDHDNPEHQRQCWHYSNFQPLWKRDNIRKQAKRVYNRVWNGSKWIYQYIPIEYEDSTSGTGP